MNLRAAIFACILTVGSSTNPSAAQDWRDAADRLGIKRVVVPSGSPFADLVEAEGALVQTPFADLKAKIERIDRRANGERQQPRIAKSVYRAELVGDNLSAGVGFWTIEHPDDSPAILPLAPLNLALVRPQVDSKKAILGHLDAGRLGLWLDGPGTHAATFEWSLRGAPGVHGVSFDMRTPASPLSTIELKLPADRTVSVAKGGALLTGPHDADKPGYRLWRLSLAGKSQVEFLVRRGADAGAVAKIFSVSETRIQLSPDHTAYDVDVQLEALHAAASEFTFEIDASLQPYDVSSRPGEVRSWTVAPGKAGSNLSLLKVQFREPLIGSGGGIRLRCAGPRWPANPTAVPRIELLGSASRRNSVKISVHPDQHLERWEPGSYRLVQAATEKDGGQTLTLMDAEPGGKNMPPRFAIRSEGVEFNVEQSTRWALDPSGMTLASDLQYSVSRGQLFSFDVRLPKNAAWRVHSVEMQPREAMQKWEVSGGVLHVDLQRGVTPRSDVTLSVQLRDARDRTLTAAVAVDFPDLEPLGANLRQGTLAIATDVHQRVELIQSSLPSTRPDATAAADPRLQYFFAFRQNPVQGRVRLVARRPELQSRVRQVATVAPDGLRIRGEIDVEPIVGQPTWVDLVLGGPETNSWKIDAAGAAIARVERLPLAEAAVLGLRLGSWGGPPAAWCGLAEPRGQVWRIHFREPLTKSITLTARLDAAPEPVDEGLPEASARLLWTIPIAAPLRAERIDGELLLQPLGTVLTNATPRGFDASAGGAASTGSTSRLYRFKRVGLFEMPTLTALAVPSADADAAQAVVESADLATSLDAAGGAIHKLRVVVWNWKAKSFRVVLPEGAAPIAARVNRIDLDRVPHSIRDGGLEVAMPTNRESGAQIFELTYRTTPSPWFGSLGRLVAAPMPKFPSMPLIARRSFRLPLGWLPLHQERMTSFDRRAPARESLASAWRADRALVEEVFPSAPPSWIESQRLSLFGAENAARRSATRGTTLGEAVSRLLQAGKRGVPVVLDAAALNDLRLSPKTATAFSPTGGPPFWEGLGLAYVPTPHAAVLTSRDRADPWSRAVADGSFAGAFLVDAASQAFDRGQDASGRFRAADVWLRDEGPVDAASPPSGYAASRDADATDWRFISGDLHGDALIAVRVPRIRATAVLLSLLVLALGFTLLAMLSPHGFFRLMWLVSAALLFGLAATPLSLRELALGPIFAVGALLALAYRQLLRREPPTPTASRPSRSTQKAVRASLAGSSAALLLIVGLCRAQAPEEKTLFLLQSEKSTDVQALVRPSLLRWLDARDAETRASLDDLVFLSTHYTGKSDGRSATVTADFEFFAPKDFAGATVPLTGVDLLEGSLLDGAPTFPVVAPAGKTGYRIAVDKAGFHRLTMTFGVPIEPTGEISFSGPAAPCSTLQWTAPATAGNLRLERCWGEQSTRVDGKTGRKILDAKRGGETDVRIQGLSAASAANSRLRVRELYHWDLRAGNRSAQGILSYDAVGEIQRVDIQLPAGIEVRSVELVDSPDGRSQGAVRAWQISSENGVRVLHVDFARPVSGSFDLAISLTPLGSRTSGTIDVRLPFPLRAVISDGMMGLRIDESDAIEKAQLLGIASVPPDAFVKEWIKHGRHDIAAPLHAFSFARGTKNPAAASLEVTPLASKPRVQTSAVWTVLPQAVDLAAEFTVVGADEFILLPIKLSDAISLRDVQGADVHHWSRNAGVLDVWLVAPKKKTTVSIIGWIPAGNPKAKAWNLPTPTVVGSPVDSATLTLASETGLALEPVDGEGLAQESLRPGAKRYRIPNGRFPADFRVRPRPAEAEFRALTTVETRDDRCEIATHIEGLADHGDLPEITLKIANWPTATPRLTVPLAGAAVAHSSRGREHIWTIKLPPRSPQRISLTVAGHLPLQPGQSIELPIASIERGGELKETILALAGVNLAGSTQIVPAPVRDNGKDLDAWPLEQARLRAANARSVRLPANVGSLAVRPEVAAGGPGTRVLDSRYRVVVGGESRWLHRAVWSLWSPAGLDLEMILPANAILAEARVDDQPASPRAVGRSTFALLIPPAPTIRTVAVSWTFSTEDESFDSPCLELATLAGIERIDSECRLYVPPGWTAAEPPQAATVLDIAMRDIRNDGRALRILGDDLATAKLVPASLTRSLQSFAGSLRQSQYRLSFIDDAAKRDAREAELKALAEAEAKRAKSLGFDAALAAAERSPWQAPAQHDFSGVDLGCPISWFQRPEATAPRPVLKRLESTSPPLALFAAALGILGLTFWTPALKTWVRFWPEQLAAVAALGFVFGGFSLVGVVLAAIAVVGRSITVSDRVRRLLRRGAAT